MISVLKKTENLKNVICAESESPLCPGNDSSKTKYSDVIIVAVIQPANRAINSKTARSLNCDFQLRICASRRSQRKGD